MVSNEEKTWPSSTFIATQSPLRYVHLLLVSVLTLRPLSKIYEKDLKMKSLVCYNQFKLFLLLHE